MIKNNRWVSWWRWLLLAQTQTHEQNSRSHDGEMKPCEVYSSGLDPVCSSSLWFTCGGGLRELRGLRELGGRGQLAILVAFRV